MALAPNNAFDDREQQVGLIIRDLLAQEAFASPLLMIDDYSADPLPADLQVERWNRFAYRNKSAQAWIPAHTYQTICVRVSRQSEAIECILHTALARLAPNGKLLIYGLNDEGIRSIDKRVSVFAKNVTPVFSKHHGKVWSAERHPDVSLKGEQKDWAQSLAIEGLPKALLTYPGTFSHGKLDPGTDFLLEYLSTWEFHGPTQTLDFGCGIGTISAVLHAQHPDMSFDLLDIDAMALAAAKTNLPEANILLADGLSHPDLKNYDLIVSNPPLHLGKDQTRGLLESFLTEAGKYLKTQGSLLFVVQKTIPVKRIAEKAPLFLKMKAENDVYAIWQGKRRGL